MTRLALALVAVPYASLARASPNAVMPHVNAGLEVQLESNDTTIDEGRVHLGASRSFSRATLRPELALGVTAGAGMLDGPGIGNQRSYLDAGPELQLGVRIGDGGWVDNRVFASVALLHVRYGSVHDKPTRADEPAPTVRLTLGANIADFAARAAADRRPGSRGWVMIALPQQFELGWTRDGATNRFGFTMSYGI